jgi:hypothetical protein
MSSAAAAQQHVCAHRLRDSKLNSVGLAMRWLDLCLRSSPNSTAILPSATLLDHIPDLVREIGKFVGSPDSGISDNSFVVLKGRELGALRHEQDASVHQLLKEYELLRGILEILTPLWKRIGGGCHLNRPVRELIEQAGFRVERIDTGYMKGPKPMTFMYEGSARPA